MNLKNAIINKKKQGSEGSNMQPPKPVNEKKLNRKKPDRIVVLILILLFIQTLFGGYRLYQDITYQVNRSKLTASAAQYISSLDQLTNQMLTDYKNDVYNNANVDTTAKQGIMSSEYTFRAIMLLTKQNSRIMEILTQIQ